MTQDELEQLFRKSRRTLWRYISAGKIPRPVQYFPMSWDYQQVRRAYLRMQQEAKKKAAKQ